LRDGVVVHGPLHDGFDVLCADVRPRRAVRSDSSRRPSRLAVRPTRHLPSGANTGCHRCRVASFQLMSVVPASGRAGCRVTAARSSGAFVFCIVQCRPRRASRRLPPCVSRCLRRLPISAAATLCCALIVAVAPLLPRRAAPAGRAHASDPVCLCAHPVCCVARQFAGVGLDSLGLPPVAVSRCSLSVRIRGRVR